MKECPFCAEEIQDRAIKCRYCGEWLEAPPAGRGEAKVTISSEPENIISLDEPHLKPIAQCPPEDLPFLYRALAKHYEVDAEKNLSSIEQQQKSAALADRLVHQHPEALLAIYRIFQLLRHDQGFEKLD